MTTLTDKMTTYLSTKQDDFLLIYMQRISGRDGERREQERRVEMIRVERESRDNGVLRHEFLKATLLVTEMDIMEEVHFHSAV